MNHLQSIVTRARIALARFVIVRYGGSCFYVVVDVLSNNEYRK